jgi:DNA-binding LacI/PurR family transcriptional regulator
MAKSPMVTIKDVARRAGVSIATVSYVLNNRASISETTRTSVLNAVAELGYRPSAVARGLRARESRTIGYSWHRVPADRWHPILDRFLYSMAEAAEAQGYHILTFTSGPASKPWLPYEELMLTRRVDGFILSDTDRNDERVRYLVSRGFPFVAFGRACEVEDGEWNFPYVDVDGEAGVRQAVEHLLALGHHRIGLIAWPDASLAGHFRHQGYIAALQAAAISLDPAWIVRAEHKESVGRQAMHTMLDLPSARRPTAVVALSDLMAIGAINAIYEAGLRPGRDVAVIGFDDIPTAQYFRPSLTTLRQPIAEVGDRVVSMLLHLIRGEELTERSVLLPPTLIVRESSGEKIT